MLQCRPECVKHWHGTISGKYYNIHGGYTCVVFFLVFSFFVHFFFFFSQAGGGGADGAEELTEEEGREILEMKNSSNIYTDMVNSIAPTVFGHSEVRMCTGVVSAHVRACVCVSLLLPC